MNKDIEKYTREVVRAFYVFLILYSGQLLDKWVIDVNIVPVCEDEESYSAFSDDEVDELINIFIDERKQP